MTALVLFFATCFLAYSNGANDNFKGVATLFGSQVASYRKAIWWATAATLGGSMTSIFLANTLIKNFSGKGLVPDAVVGSPNFLLAVALAGGMTVMIATIAGFPVSTTHALLGALVGSGFAAAGTNVNLSLLGVAFFLPMLASPIIAAGLGTIGYRAAHWLRVRSGVTKEWCVCINGAEQLIPVCESSSVFSVQVAALPSVTLSAAEYCRQNYRGKILGGSVQRTLDLGHFLSAGSICFARGLNDTPKILAILLVIQALDIRWGLLTVAVGMALGGLINARKVALTMSKKITTLSHGQGFMANITSAFLVIMASRFGLPVSTTHVTCGSLFGIGLLTRQANWRVMKQIVMSWVLTLPAAVVLSWAIYSVLPS